MKIPRFSSIRQRFIFGLVTVVALIILLFSSVLILYNIRAIKKELRQQLDNISDLSQVSLSTALWEYNHKYVSDYLDSLFLYEDIVFVSVMDGNKTIKKKVRLSFQNRDFAYFNESQDFITKEADVMHKQVNVGKIILVMSHDRVAALIVNNSVSAISLLCLVIAAILITTYILLQKYLFRPLSGLKNSARLIAAGNWDTEIDTGSQDEIGNLALTFSVMIQNIRAVTTSRDELNREIREREKAEKALRESNERFLQLADNTNDVFWLIDISDPDNYRILYVNPAFEKIWQRRSGEVYEDPDLWYRCIHEDDIERVSREYTDFLHGKRDYNTEFRIVRPDNSMCHIWSRGNLIRNENGDIIRAAGISQDITERYHAEKEREKLENQLRHAHKMEAIGTLAGGIAHDFNNILGIIIGNTELAIDDVPDWNPARLYLGEIKTASLRAKDVVRQLLSFSRKTEKEKKQVRLASVVKESLQLLRSSIPRTIEIRHNLSEDCAPILGDHTQIHQVIINLCTNASHAMSENGGILEVNLEDVMLDEQSVAPFSDLTPGKYVRMSVSDTGDGIAPEVRDRIFDPYFTTKDIGKGTGMGLAVVHGIIQNHGGAISAYSEPGKGTTFKILFPALENQIERETRAEESIPTGTERILFVDDEEALVSMGRQILERLGYKVEARTNPIAALELFRADPDLFDLIITDMTMPRMTGDRLIREILTIRDNIPIILCTGFSEKITVQSAKETDSYKYIEKPLNKRELAIAVREALDGK